MKPRRSIAAMALLLLSNGAGATSICRWVDQTGRTQLAVVVPDKYKKVAVCTDSQQYELSGAQRREAEQAVAQERAQTRQAAVMPPLEGPSSAPRPARSASSPDVRLPIDLVTDATDCPTWQRIYDESVECFGPYRTARGGIKSEAFDRCNVVPNPEPKCGPRSN